MRNAVTWHRKPLKLESIASKERKPKSDKWIDAYLKLWSYPWERNNPFLDYGVRFIRLGLFHSD